MNPFPSKSNIFDRISAHGLIFKSIIDIGVRECTAELIQHFPKAKHYLFEPVSFYFDVIRNNYSSLDYELYQLALSDKSGACYQVSTCIDGTGNPTHSQVSEQPAVVDGKTIVSCDKVQMSRLDDALDVSSIVGPILLKLDVDGHELPILHGAIKSLEYISVIIVETTCTEMIKRASFLEQHGFDLIELADLCYFANTLWQFDMVFMNSELRKKNRNFSPWGNVQFGPETWFELR